MKINRKKVDKHIFLRSSKGGKVWWHVSRNVLPGKRTSWEACAKLSSGTETTGRRRSHCVRGKTPRAALSNALKSLAREVAGRRGVFKGLRKKQ